MSGLAWQKQQGAAGRSVDSVLESAPCHRLTEEGIPMEGIPMKAVSQSMGLLLGKDFAKGSSDCLCAQDFLAKKIVGFDSVCIFHSHGDFRVAAVPESISLLNSYLCI